jgi:catechol 2,3-dioxygenase-like lactoylglutathione lyase family enzyme
VEGVRHGLTNPAIAARCDLTLDAVKFHVSSALGKLGLTSRRELRQWTGVRADSALARKEIEDTSQDWSLGQVSRLARDVAQMADWLRDTLGLPQIMRFENAVFFDCGGVRLYLSAGDPATNSLLYFRVADLHARVETLRAAGVTIASAPHRIHVHEDGTEEWMAFVTDPDGGNLGLMSAIPPVKGA